MTRRLFAVLVVISAILIAQEQGAMEWHFNGSLRGWKLGGFKSHEVKADAFYGSVDRDAKMYSPTLNIDAADYNTLEVAMKCSISAGGEIFYRMNGEEFSEKKFRWFKPKQSEGFLIYSFNLAGAKGWNGKIEQIRFDPINPPCDIAVKYIKLIKRGIGSDSIMAEDGSQISGLPIKNGVISWNFKNSLQGWQPACWKKYELKEDGFHGLSNYDCQIVSPDLNIKAEEFDTMYVAMKSDMGGSGEVFIGSNGSVFSERQYMTFSTLANEELKLYSYDLKHVKGWQGTINRIRFDPLNPAGGNIHIANIMLVKSGQNLILNGDCEIALNGKLSGWNLKGASIASNAASGVNCLAFKSGDVAEIEFPNPARLGEFSVSFMAKGAPVKAEIVFNGAEGTPIETIAIATEQSNDWRTFKKTVNIPELAYDGFFRFAGTGDGWLDALRCNQITEGSCKSPKGLMPSWKGSWIWCDANKNEDNCMAYVRKNFTLPNKELDTADIQLTCDDSFALYINGEFVATTHGLGDAWKFPRVLDVKKFLKAGDNTILVEVKDVGAQQGFIADFVAVTKDGEFITISTGKDWEAALEKDGPWAPPVVFGRPPCDPWGYPTYVTMRTKSVLAGPIAAKLVNLPKEVRPGQRLPLEMEIKGADFPGAIPVRCVVLQNGKDQGEEWSEKGLTIANGKASLKIDAYFPLKLKDGPCSIRVEFVGAPLQGNALSAEFTVKGNGKKTYDFPKVELVSQDGVTNIKVNGEVIDPTQALFTKPDRLHQMLTRDAGIHLWGIGAGSMGFFERGFDYSVFDNEVEQYLSIDPDAWLIINYPVNTSAQAWWMKQHPEAHCRYEDGNDILNDYKSSKGLRPAYASKVWRETYADVIRRFIRHIKSTPYAERIVGFHSINGISAEWFHWGSQSRNFVDYSDAGREDFRRWLKAKYGTDAALQKAWGRADVTFANAAIPTGDERRNSANGIYFDPKTQMNVLDYNDYQHDNCIETINYFNRVIKEETDGRVICGTYYGYVFNLFDSTFFGQGSGHFRVETMHRSPEFDYAIAPDSYSQRHVGGTSKTMTPGGSFRLNGKFFWNQADLRSHWIYQRINDGFVATVQGSVDCMYREFARNMTEGNAIQWYDFSNGWTMGDRRLMIQAGKLYDLSCKYRNTVKDWAPENYLLVVLDERFMGRWNALTNVGGSELHQNQEEYLHRAGVPWRVVLFSDLLRHPELLKHRAMLFVDAYRLTDEYRQFLDSKVLKDGRTVAFVGCPGMLTPQGLSADYLSKTMGCKFDVINEPTRLLSKGTAVWKDIEGNEWGNRSNYDSTQFLMPKTTDGCEVLAKLADGRPSALYKAGKDCSIFWSAAPGLSPAVIRAISRRANVPVVASDNDGLYAGLGFIGIHASKLGEKEINLIGDGTPKDILSGQTWPKGTKTIKLMMRLGETRVFVME